MAIMNIRDGLRTFNVTIDISQHDIDHGMQQDCQYCPAALALQRAVPNATYLAVAGSYTKVDLDGVTYKATSDKLGDFTTIFDWYRSSSVPTKIELNFVEMI